ncbi:MAG: hypothetical protein RLZZ241_434 [Bacteroidota bacterium]
MRNRIYIVLTLFLPIQIILLQWAAKHTAWVEKWYSNGLYPVVSGFFRWLYGAFSLSVGDLIYLILLALGIIFCTRKLHEVWRHFWQFTLQFLAWISVICFTFYSLWGLNYYRRPLAQTLNLNEKYELEELKALTLQLAQESNALQLELTGDTLNPVLIPYSEAEILRRTVQSYHLLEEQYPNFRYRHPSLKPSLIAKGLSYMGYGGYLNPFTGEAQVNILVPNYRLPVIAAHEVGHQLGYAAENETNFIGYLATRHNQDRYFQYAAATFALNYCLSELNRSDSTARKAINVKLNQGVRANFAESYAFWQQYENPMEPVFKAVFNSYLEANLQKEGIRSYNRIVSLLLAYHRNSDTQANQ